MIEVSVKIYFSFRSNLDKESDGLTVRLSGGSTIKQAIEKLSQRFPSLEGKILNGSGQLRRFIQVRVKDGEVTKRAALETKLDNKQTLLIIPKLGGG